MRAIVRGGDWQLALDDMRITKAESERSVTVALYARQPVDWAIDAVSGILGEGQRPQCDSRKAVGVTPNHSRNARWKLLLSP